MADWSNPKLSSTYVNFLNELNIKIVEAAQIYPNGTNLPNAAMRLERTTNVFQEWNGSAWGTRPIGVAGGGTGGASGTEARVNLGFGTMCLQNSNGVNITGGTITGTNLDANYLTTGTIPPARFPDPLPALNGGNLHNLNAGALAFGQVPHPARLGTGAVGSGLMFLADNLTWKAVSMAPRIFHISMTLAANVQSLIQALPATVETSKAFISPETALLRHYGSTGNPGQVSVMWVYFCDAAGNAITAGPAAHIRLFPAFADFGNSVLQIFKFAIVEWT